jgi:hypothetical protein
MLMDDDTLKQLLRINDARFQLCKSLRQARHRNFIPPYTASTNSLSTVLVVFPRVRLFNRRFIGLVYRFFESSDCFTEGFAQFGELAGTKNHQGNHKNNDQLRHTKTSKHTTPPDAITLCPGVRDVNLSGNLARRLPAMRYPINRKGAEVLDTR